MVLYRIHTGSYRTCAEQLLAVRGIPLNEIMIVRSTDTGKGTEKRSGRRSVPQVSVGDLPIDGFDRVRRLQSADQLDSLLFAQEI